jgi:hypothetical protein
MKKSIRILALPLLAAAAFAATSAQASSFTYSVADYGMLDSGAAAAAGADHTVKIDANTRYVNVTDGDTVRFDLGGGKGFTFTFDAWSSIDSFDLAAIAPAGVSVPNVRVYIAQNPLYVG